MQTKFPMPAWVSEKEKKERRRKLIGESARVKRYSLCVALAVFPRELIKTTKFNRAEADILVHIFWTLTNGRMQMTYEQLRQHFISTFDCTNRVNFIFRGNERTYGNIVKIEEFFRIFSIMLRGTLEDKAKYVFEVYDLQGDGELTKEVLTTFLKDAYVPRFFEPDEASDGVSTDAKHITETVEYLLKKLDKDKTGVITKKKFVLGVLENPLLLECLASVFPARDSLETYRELLLYKKR